MLTEDQQENQQRRPWQLHQHKMSSSSGELIAFLFYQLLDKSLGSIEIVTIVSRRKKKKIPRQSVEITMFWTCPSLQLFSKMDWLLPSSVAAAWNILTTCWLMLMNKPGIFSDMIDI